MSLTFNIVGEIDQNWDELNLTNTMVSTHRGSKPRSVMQDGNISTTEPAINTATVAMNEKARSSDSITGNDGSSFSPDEISHHSLRANPVVTCPEKKLPVTVHSPAYVPLWSDNTTSQPIWRSHYSRLLPARPTVFHGRDKEVECLVAQALVIGSAPIGVLGPGGIGKTALALEVLHNPFIQNHFKDERYFLSCDGATSPDEVLVQLAVKLGVQQSQDTSLWSSTVEAIRSCQRALIVLDNFESILSPKKESLREASEGFLAQLVVLDELTVVVTARGKQLPGNLTWSKAGTVELEKLSPAAARSTFKDLCCVKPAVLASEAEDTALTTLLREVDFVPLAVNLLARHDDPPSILLREWSKYHTVSLEAMHHDGTRPELSYPVSIKISLDQLPTETSSRRPRELLSLIAHLPAGLFPSVVGLLRSTIPNLDLAAQDLLDHSIVHTGSYGELWMLKPVRHYVAVSFPISAAALFVLEKIYISMAHIEPSIECYHIDGPAYNVELPKMDSILEAALNRRDNSALVDTALEVSAYGYSCNQPRLRPLQQLAPHVGQRRNSQARFIRTTTQCKAKLLASTASISPGTFISRPITSFPVKSEDGFASRPTTNDTLPPGCHTTTVYSISITSPPSPSSLPFAPNTSSLGSEAVATEMKPTISAFPPTRLLSTLAPSSSSTPVFDSAPQIKAAVNHTRLSAVTLTSELRSREPSLSEQTTMTKDPTKQCPPSPSSLLQIPSQPSTVSPTATALSLQHRPQRVLFPARPRYFVGREEEVYRLVNMTLDQTGGNARIIIKGLPGIGKTTLATIVITDRRVKTVFGASRIFIRCGDLKGADCCVHGLLCYFALKLGLTDEGDVYHKVVSLLMSFKRFMIVLDGLELIWNSDDSKEVIELERLLDLLSDIEQVVLIATVRGRAIPQNVRWKNRLDDPLNPLSSADACSTFLEQAELKKATEIDEILHLEKLVEQIDGHPQAVMLLARLRDLPSRLLREWTEYDQWRTDIIEADQHDGTAPELSMSVSIMLSIKRLPKNDWRPLELLRRCQESSDGLTEIQQEELRASIPRFDRQRRLLGRGGLVQQGDAGELTLLSPIRHFKLPDRST